MSKRNASSISQGHKLPKGKRVRTVTHKWIQSDVDKVLDYMVETIQSNRKIEEPSAASYYGAMANNLGILDLNANQIKCKVNTLKKGYMEMVEWRGKTGQGVMENSGADSVKSYILKKCPDFEKLEEIFGTKASVNPPYVHESDMLDLEHSIVFEEADVLQEIEVSTSNEPSTSCRPSPTTQEDKTAGLKRQFKTSMSMTKNGHKKDPLSSIIEIQELRAKEIGKKTELEFRRFESDLEFKTKHYDLEVKILETTRELKILELEQAERLEKYKLEMEKEERLEKFKLELEYKLKC